MASNYDISGSTLSYASTSSSSGGCCGRRAAGVHMQCGGCPQG